MGERTLLERPSVRAPSLFTWATGSFHTALLVVAGVAAVHLAGRAGDLLGAGGTLPGAVAYLYLWAVTVWTTDRAMTASEVTPGGIPDRRAAGRAALRWGAATGLAVFLVPFVVVAGFLLVAAGLGAVPALLVGGAVTGVLAAAVGAAVGVLFALLDAALLEVAATVTDERQA